MKQSIDVNVRFQLDKHFPGDGKLFKRLKTGLFRRRTYTPDGKDWVTEFGVEVLGFAIWIHVPEELWDPDIGFRGKK